MADSLAERYAKWIIYWRWPVILMSGLVTIVLGVQIAHIHLDNRLRIWVPSGNPYVVATQRIQNEFGIRSAVIISVIPNHGTIFQTPVLREIRDIQRKVQHLKRAISRNVLSIAARKVKSIHGNAGGMSVHRFLWHVPKTAHGMEILRRRLEGDRLYDGLLVAKNDKSAAIVAAFRLNPKNPSYLTLYKKLRNITALPPSAAMRIVIGGQSSWFAALEKSMQQMPSLFGGAFLAIMLVQYLAFRRFLGAILPLVTAVLSVVWSLGLLAIFGIPMDILNSVTPVLIMAVGTGHSTQMLKRYYEEYETLTRQNGMSAIEMRREAVARSLAQTGPVMLLAGTIAIGAFLSLTLAPIAMIRHFGAFTAMGIGSILILEMTFMPALRVLVSSGHHVNYVGGLVNRTLERIADRLAEPRHAKAIMMGVFVLLAVTAAGMYRLRANNNPKDYFPRNSLVRESNRILNANLAGTGSLFFRIAGGSPGAIKNPAVLAAMERFQAFLKHQKGVGKTLSIADYVQQMNMAMHDNLPQYDGVPKNRRLVAQYLFLYAASASPNDFNSVVDHRYQRALIWVFTKFSGTRFTRDLIAKARRQIRRDFPASVHVTVGGGLAETMAINKAVVREKMENVLQIMLVVFLMATIAFRSVAGGLFVSLPLAFIVIANFGVMGWLGLPLDMSTVTSASLAMGIGADYEVYLLFRFREALARTGDFPKALRESLRTAGTAVVFVTLAISSGFAVLLIAKLKFYTQLAAMVIATMFISLLLALLLLRAMTVVMRPRFLFGKKGFGVPAMESSPLSEGDA